MIFQFKDLDLSFIKVYEFYLKSDNNLAQSSAYKVVQGVKTEMFEDYLDKKPFKV